MTYLALLTIVLGTIGMILALKFQWHAFGGKWVVYSMVSHVLTLLGALLCVVALGWWGLAPILGSMLSVGVYRAITHAPMRPPTSVTAADIANNTATYRRAAKEAKEFEKYMQRKYGKS
jgi:hypothetical protein